MIASKLAVIQLASQQAGCQQVVFSTRGSMYVGTGAGMLGVTL